MVKILVIEDSTAQRLYIKAIFERSKAHSFLVIQARDGREGLALAASEMPDAILCDINMPVMDGFEFVANLRNKPELASIPIVMITSDSRRDAMRQAMGTGADDYLTKPFSERELIQAINSQISKRNRHLEQTKKSINQLRQSILTTLPHELRTPLTSIISGSELLIKRGERLSPIKTREILDVIHRGGKRLMNTISKYLELIEVRSNPSPSGKERFEISERWIKLIFEDSLTKEIIFSSLNDTDDVSQAQDHLGRIIFEIQPMWVNLNQQDIIRALLELIVNALRFSPPGSIVKIVGVKHRDQYMFDVLNEGASLPKNFELLSGDFMQFNRDEMEQQGLGLGLPLAIGLLERNASRLSWVRIDGQPNTVRVCVPCLS